MCFFRPDGKKKAYVRLTADHDALDVANKVRFTKQSGNVVEMNVVSFRLDSSKGSTLIEFIFLLFVALSRVELR